MPPKTTPTQPEVREHGPGDVQQDTGAAGADGERQTIGGTDHPAADTPERPGGAGGNPKAGA